MPPSTRTASLIPRRVSPSRADLPQDEGLLPADIYCPVFMNYGFNRVDYWGRLRPESRAFARRVAAEYDPDGLFRTRTGGWKP